MTEIKRTIVERTTDTIIGLISDRRLAFRQHFRRMEKDITYREGVFALMRVRGYKAAETKKSDIPFRGKGGSADAQILPGLETMRNRTREINQDDPIGSGLTLTFTNNVIGPGIMPQAMTGSDLKNNRLEDAWKQYNDVLAPADRLNGMTRQRMIFRKLGEDGDIFEKFSKRSPREKMFVEIIEAERVATPMDQVNNPNIRDGVEKDSLGIPVAYHVLKHHPGDSFAAAMSDPNNFERVPAIDITHFKIANRPGQTRGLPMFHAILQDLRDMDYLIFVSLKRAQMAAVLATFIKSAEKFDSIWDMTAQTYGFQLDHDLVPGMIFKLMPGEDIVNLSPNFPAPEFTAFIIMLARRVGAALGVSWQVVLKDFGDSNYSSARTDLLETRQVYTYFQQLFIRDVANMEWKRVQEDARLMGMHNISDADIAKVFWIPPGWKWVDPVKEAAGAEIELRIGTSTLRDLCRQKGLDWQETIRQRVKEKALEKELLDEAGLLPDPAEADANAENEAASKALVAAMITEEDPKPEPKPLVLERLALQGGNGGLS